ncbi:MAG: hypothetical protein KJ749_08850, partial [Planctomycetes bacterium]|nr:hypothetical protein [Planctomycetota bacterium]
MKIRPRECAILFALLAIVVLASGTPEEDRTARIRRLEAPFRKLEFGQSLVKVRPSTDFVGVTFEELPKDVKVQMYTWLASTVQREAHPQRRGWPYKDGGPVY